MTRDELVEITARTFCDAMYVASWDSRRSRWVDLKEWRKDNYRKAASDVIDTLSSLLPEKAA